MSAKVTGILCGVASAFAFGTTVVTGRSLAKADLGFQVSLGVPFTLGGAILVVALIARRRPLFPAPGERLWIVLLGAGIYATQSALFFSALERGTAAAVTLLFYAYPAVVVLLEIPLERRWPAASTAAAVVLAMIGATTIVASSGEVDITRTGVGFALGAGGMFAVNLLISERRVSATDSVTAAAWLAITTGLAQLGWGVATASLENPSEHWNALLGLGAARAVAFAFMFAALRRLGPANTSVALTFEALFAILLAATFISEPVQALQGVGGVAILAAAVVIARTPDPRPAPAAAPLP
ncbi:MAG TPA: DMT family transporter [Acidimicrobiia bacterium]|nr:DMT family transporter [Acidimicrobiia bacterium]